MKTFRPPSGASNVPDGEAVTTEDTTPFHQPLEEEEIQAAHDGLSTGSREEGPSQQEN